MSDSDKELKIKITTTADLSGAKQLSQALGETYKDAAGNAEKFKLQQEALKDLIRTLGGEVAPELGEALAAAFDGPEIAAVAAFGLITKLVFDKIKEAAENAAHAIQLSFNATLEASKSSAENADELAASLEKASKPADAIKTGFESSRSLLGEMEAQHAHILESIEKEQIAEAGGDEKKIAAIKARFELTKQTFDTTAGLRKLDEQREQLEARNFAQGGLNASADAATAALTAEKNNPSVVSAQAAVDTIEKKYGKDVVGTLQAIIDRGPDARASLEALRGYNLPGAEGARLGSRAVLEEANEAQKTLDAYKKNRVALDTHTEFLNLLTKQVEEARTKAVDNAKTITDQTETFKNDQGNFVAGVAGGDIQKAIALALKAQSGQTLNPDEEAFERTIGAMIAGRDVSVSIAEKMFQAASKNADIQTGFLNRLFAVIEKTPNFAALKIRLQQMESRFRDQPPQTNIATASNAG